MQTFPKKSRNRSLGLVGAVAASVVAVTLFANSGSSESAADIAVREQLAVVAESFNAQLPTMLDQYTQLDSTEALPERRFAYRYTIVGMQKIPQRYQIVNEARPKVVKAYRTADNMREMRELNVTVLYVYSDEKGDEVVRFEVGPEDL
jgi:hypothetical protein